MISLLETTSTGVNTPTEASTSVGAFVLAGCGVWLSCIARLTMSRVLEITGYDVYVSDAGTHCEFRAIVEDSVVVAPATRWEPEQWGAAECVGSVLLADDELPPGEDNELEQLTLADSVDNWELPEPTDHEMMSANHLCPAWHDGL